jgi:hypothetical protein
MSELGDRIVKALDDDEEIHAYASVDLVDEQLSTVAEKIATIVKPPADLLHTFDRMKAAVMHGVTWDGTPESIGGVTKDEALDIVSDFITTFDEWRGGAA